MRLLSSVLETLSTDPSRFSNALYSEDCGFDFMGTIVMAELPLSETVSKLDAARRQLATAIELWFHDKDQVSIHTLSFAAYEVIHSVSRKKGRTKSLIFDSPAVKEEYRGSWSAAVKRTANFLKHADHDPDGTIDFNPITSELFIIFAIVGLETVGILSNEYEFTFMWWFLFNRPHLLTQEGAKKISEFFPLDAIAELSGLPKVEFFDISLETHRSFLKN
jgi:hypothetical protein